ncbi:Immunoglobulin-like domain containing receptor 2 [Dissostichus eleginoides]|nr:Immunoglobulin-like domain containing receptor 2 [Dissostichus eleginoides]
MCVCAMVCMSQFGRSSVSRCSSSPWSSPVSTRRPPTSTPWCSGGTSRTAETEPESLHPAGEAGRPGLRARPLVPPRVLRQRAHSPGRGLGAGASMTLAEHYKGRDIAIVNSNVFISHITYYCLRAEADLRIGELQWGDSGVYYCKVVIADDLEGKNEAQLELLVLGRTGQKDDILPEFDVEIMPEWVFVGSVVLGIYEAGKMAKSGPPPPQVPVYPYYIPGVPTVVPLAPPSHVEPQMASIPSVENNLAGARSGYRLKASPHQDSMKVLYYVEKELGQFPSAKMAAHKPSSLSELSSLHDGGTSDFRHTYQTVQMKALPPIADLDDQMRRDRRNLSDDELDRRWNPPSEHLQRKTLSRRGRTGSLDELEDFAQSYSSRSRPERGYERDYSPPRRFYREEDEGWGRRSPSPLPQKRRDTWDSDRPCPPPKNKGYDDTLLSSMADEDSDTPSKGSSRGKGSFYSRSPSNRPEEEDSLPPYSEREAERYRRADPNADRYRTVEPPRAERYKPSEPAMRPFCYTRPPQDMSQTLREERERSRNLSTALSRDTLIV